METYFLNLESSDVPIDRPKINAQISRQLAKYCPSKNDIIEPLNVQHRLGEFELFDKYIYCKAYDLVEHQFTKATTNVSPIPNTEELEVLVSPQDMIYMSNSGNATGNGTVTATKSQVSLLKPKSERTSMGLYALHIAQTTPEPQPSRPVPPLAIPTSKPSAAINNSRLNLLQALKKAKDQKLANVTAPVVVQVQSRAVAEKPKPIAATIKTEPLPVKTSSTAVSSSVSSGSDDIDLPEEDVEPVILGKEAFLRVVGLCTQTYKEYIMSRRSERKRRNVTSTERGDFHYGKLELFEVSFFSRVLFLFQLFMLAYFMYLAAVQ